MKPRPRPTCGSALWAKPQTKNDGNADTAGHLTCRVSLSKAPKRGLLTDGKPRKALLSGAFENVWRKVNAWRTEEPDGRPSSRTARVFELFFLDIPGFSDFLLLSYPMCGP